MLVVKAVIHYDDNSGRTVQVEPQDEERGSRGEQRWYYILIVVDGAGCWEGKEGMEELRASWGSSRWE